MYASPSIKIMAFCICHIAYKKECMYTVLYSVRPSFKSLEQIDNLPNSMQYFSTLPLLYRLYQHCMVKFFHCMVKFFHCMVKFFHCMVIYLNSLQILREILCITTSDAFALQIMLFNKSCCILEALFISAQHFLSFVVF